MACEQTQTPWQDISDHHVQLVSVDDNVQLEVLDWGGDGRPVVLLAGLGNTAHVYDEFAPELAGDYHVYGITRRGFGASSWPDSGYTVERLAEDVRKVTEALDLAEVVLVGHSVAGRAMTHLASRSVERVAGLIYLDAANDPRLSTFAPRLQEIFDGLPQPPAPPSDPEEFQKLYGYPMPEVELRNRRAHAQAWAIPTGTTAPDYASIQVPTLAIYASFGSPADVSPWLKDEAPDLLEEMFELRKAHLEQDIEEFRRTSRSKVVLLEGADHYVFLTHKRDVLREMRAFLDDLGAEPSP